MTRQPGDPGVDGERKPPNDFRASAAVLVVLAMFLILLLLATEA